MLLRHKTRRSTTTVVRGKCQRVCCPPASRPLPGRSALVVAVVPSPHSARPWWSLGCAPPRIIPRCPGRPSSTAAEHCHARHVAVPGPTIGPLPLREAPPTKRMSTIVQHRVRESLRPDSSLNVRVANARITRSARHLRASRRCSTAGASCERAHDQVRISPDKRHSAGDQGRSEIGVASGFGWHRRCHRLEPRTGRRELTTSRRCPRLGVREVYRTVAVMQSPGSGACLKLPAIAVE